MHPHRVHGPALMAVTTTSREEVDWTTEGMERIYPEAWHEFSVASGAIARERPVEAYARRLAAEAWDRWESWHVSLLSPELRGEYIAEERRRMTFALLVTHYWSNEGFLSNGQEILGRIHELDRIPGHLIHGRRDVSGPAVTPWKLHQRWCGSKLTIVEDEGHAGSQSLQALVAAAQEIRAGLQDCYLPGPLPRPRRQVFPSSPERSWNGTTRKQKTYPL
ncbi:alpha/beta fold hydrolase [Arthrobacter alpinus]|uniref:alpha/beta fold hydrolase n=2 Tax=Arthrobacter TaxID=1663 RepID=UPI001646592A|nr:hypothetical protein [Arthrobacter alpinus]